jgi:hypothetical protein
MKDRVDALAEVSTKMSSVDDDRSLKEEELKQVEAGLVSTLVSQQRALMTVIRDVPLAAEDLELPREYVQESESEGEDTGAP